MIIDRLENWRCYAHGPAWERAFDFLLSIGPDAKEQEYALDGNDIYARVMSYNTRPRESAVLEAHRKYLDIQSTLVAAEGIEWFPQNKLEVKTPYNQDKDVEFYNHPAFVPARIDVFPGLFVALFPKDAHMPQLIVGEESKCVKKVVVKINVDLLGA